MPDTLPSPAPEITAGEQLDAYHAQVVSDKRLDFRYAEPINNADKVELICEILPFEVAEFDLAMDFPLETFSNSNDTALLRCGLYIADMRREFYGLIIGSSPETVRHDVWEAQAAAEYWMEQFDAIMYRRQTGEKRAPRRVYQ